MTDRELLELAAKAAGIAGRWHEVWSFERLPAFIIDGAERPWRPLTDDGDALRLAVKLRQMRVHIDAESSAAFRNDCHGMPAEFAGEPHNGDPYAATRRAIVRAAAAIGAQA